MTNCIPALTQQLQTPKFMDAMIFMELPKKDQTYRKVQTAPWPNSIYKLSMTAMVWNISTGQLGLNVWLWSLPAPAHLVIR